jgi:hypothetical protein
VFWWETPAYKTLKDEAEGWLNYGQPGLRSEPIMVAGQPGYLVEDETDLRVMTRWQGYTYEFDWSNPSPDNRSRLLDLMFPHIRFVSQTAKPTPTPVPLPEWHEIARWEGSGIKTTESFHVDGDFRISWTASGIVRDGYDVFQIMVYADGEFYGVAANFMCLDTVDMSYVHTIGGSFYLLINSTMNWIVTVETQ